jgi:hypothetical protein
MKSADLKLGVEYAVIPCWEYSSADKKDLTKVRRKDIVKAVLVDLNKYEYQVYRSVDQSDSNFRLAPAGSRSIGYIVEAVNPTVPENTYSIARPQDILAPYAELEARWTAEEAQHALREAEEARKRAEQERKDREERDRAERMKKSVITSLQSIIGAKADTVEVHFRNRFSDSGGLQITLDLKIMESLIEKVLEAKDMVGY